METHLFKEFVETSGYVSLSIGAVSVGFNPVKLVLMVSWFYLCLYSVRHFQLNPVVPKNRKALVNTFALMLGPILWLAMIIIDSARRSSISERSFFSLITERFGESLSTIRPFSPGKKQQEEKISLLDSSGIGIKEIYGHGKSTKEDRHILELTEQIIFEALENRASDILIDPQREAVYKVRFRVDGVLRAVREMDSGFGQAVINSIKAVSSMDISEHRRPQDGAFTARTANGLISFRVASAGVVGGEKLSIRVLNSDADKFTLAETGLSRKQQKIIRDVIAKPSGMVLVCGPTGSGKTTTMYAMLNEIDFYTRNIITVEDPIECVLPNCSQIEVNPRADITFAKSLRSILRQDPDVICVGEIRDEESAAIALRASQTGHLVLATIHCDSNAAALVRLLDLGVSPLLMSSGLSMLVSQRLLRRLCPRCKRPIKLKPGQKQQFCKKGIDYSSMFRARGCKKCAGTGYRGRIGVFDILLLDEKIKAKIADGQLSVDVLKTEVDKRGKSNLYKQGLKLVVSGVTSLEELKRVLG